ncbi:MAG: DMT family transporter [Roseateles sp.]|uniref:DMT family transporter n=1 Tax=Roseateles sp. TaxID=1971397 RepID=UPI0039E8B3C0
MAFIIKLEAKQFSVPDILFIRSASSACFVLLLRPVLRFPLRTPVFGLHARRSAFGLVSMATWYYTLGVLPMGVSVTLNYLSPLFLGLILYLGDGSGSKPSTRELGYLLLGLLGVIVLLNPFSGRLQPGDVIPVASGVCASAMAALAFKDVRVLKRAAQNEWQMVFYFSAIAAVLSFPLTSLARLHIGHDVQGGLLLVMAGVLGALGQFGVSKAFGSGDPIVAASLQYLTVVFSLLLAWLALGETVSLAQLTGVGIIVAAALLNIAARGRRPSGA